MFDILEHNREGKENKTTAIKLTSGIFVRLKLPVGCDSRVSGEIQAS